MRENKDKDMVSFLASEVRNTWSGVLLGAATESYGCAVLMFIRFTFEQYNLSARFPGKNDFFSLPSCTKDIKSHLRQLKVAQTSVVSEKRPYFS